MVGCRGRPAFQRASDPGDARPTRSRHNNVANGSPPTGAYRVWRGTMLSNSGKAVVIGALTLVVIAAVVLLTRQGHTTATAGSEGAAVLPATGGPKGEASAARATCVG